MNTVGVNEFGRRVGEDHHRAKLSDHEVELMRRLHEAGLGFGRIAKKFDVSKTTVKNICRYLKRCQSVFRRKVLK